MRTMYWKSPNNLRETEVNFTVALLKEPAGTDGLSKSFRLFMPAAGFVDIGAFLQHAVITDKDRYEDHVFAGTVSEGLEQHGKKPQFRQNHLAGSAAGPLDEEFDIEPLLEQFVQVF